MTTALVDGDLVAYMAAAGNKQSLDFGDGDPIEVSNLGHAISSCFRMIDRWSREAGCSRIVVCLSTGDNFRKKVLPSYKANRASVERPETLPGVIDAIRTEYEVLEHPGLEADDLMGIYGSHSPNTHVIVSRDKDMLTIPGRVYNPDHRGKPRKVTKGIADHMFYRQTLMGDSTDNYTGIPGVGPKAADDILNKSTRLLKSTRTITRGKNKGKVKTEWTEGGPCSWWQAILDRAEKAGMTEDEVITQARVARILRWGEFDFETNEVKLWHPRGHEEFLKV